MTSGALSLALLLLAFPAAAQTWNLEALMLEMAQVPASRARFVETRHFKLLTQPLELKGSLSYERPNRLSKHVQSPFDELLAVDGDTLTVTGKKAATFSLREQPAAGALVESVRATLAGDRAQLERYYRAQLSGTRAAWRLRLVPRDARVKDAVDSIVLSGAAQRLQRIEVDEAGGDRSVTTILHGGK